MILTALAIFVAADVIGYSSTPFEIRERYPMWKRLLPGSGIWLAIIRLIES